MLTDELKYEIGDALKSQATNLLSAQSALASSTFTQRTGTLTQSLQGSPTVSGLSVQLDYPKYIRFLDMKKSRTGKKKKVYAPIYNRQVYGFLVLDIRRRLNAIIPKGLVKTIQDTFKEVNK